MSYPCKNCILLNSCSNRLSCSKILNHHQLQIYLINPNINKFCPDCGNPLIKCSPVKTLIDCKGSCVMCNNCNIKISGINGARIFFNTAWCWNGISSSKIIYSTPKEDS